jgi:hypothetical protein
MLKPNPIPPGAAGARILLGRIDEQVAKASRFGEDSARDGNREDAWLADRQLRDLRRMKAQLEEKLKTFEQAPGT